MIKKQNKKDEFVRNKENKFVRDPICNAIKNDKLKGLKNYIPVEEFGIKIDYSLKNHSLKKIDYSLNIDIIAIDQNFGLKGHKDGYEQVIAIECKYNADDINKAIQISLAQAIMYQISFKKVYIAVNKNDSDPSDYLKYIIEELGIGLITVKHSKEIKIEIYPSKSKFFNKSDYEKNTFDRAFLTATFMRVCKANGYLKKDLYPKWGGSHKGNPPHLWVGMPIIKDHKDESEPLLGIGCAYELKSNEKANEAALRLSIKKSIKLDDLIKNEIKDNFKKKRKMRDPIEWDYDFTDLMKSRNYEEIEREMKKRIKWVNNKLKDKIKNIK